MAAAVVADAPLTGGGGADQTRRDNEQTYISHHCGTPPRSQRGETNQFPLNFEVAVHGDIFAIVEKLGLRDDFTPEMDQAFGVGLKLFSEVMLENKGNPMFEAFLPHFGQFMKTLKRGIAPA